MSVCRAVRLRTLTATRSNRNAAANPLDVLKTRLQCAEESVSMRSVLRGVLREGGWAGFYSGLIPRLAAAVPRSVCTVLFYERAIALCRKTER